jgi:predicted nucleic acid-binding protein
MNLPVAIDTIVLIRGIRQEPDPDDPKAVERAKGLIAQCQEDKTPIIVPSVALGEFLAGTPKGDIAEHVRLVDENFQVAPFDAMAAVYAGEIWRKHKGLMGSGTLSVHGVGDQLAD